MTTYRYRQLFAVRDQAAIDEMRDALRGDADVERTDEAEQEAPKQVLANEHEGTFEVIVEQLRAGELMKTDLVFSNGSWTTFEQSPDFYEVCEALVDTRARSANRKIIVRGLIAAVLFAVVVLLRVLLRQEG